MPASLRVVCACWPRTAPPSGKGRQIRLLPPLWSRVQKPNICWRWPACSRPARVMSRSTRWTVATLVVIVALGVGLWTQLGRDGPAGRPGQAPAREHRDADTAEALAEPRSRADLAPCPADGAGAGPAKLRGITVECAADGAD